MREDTFRGYPRRVAEVSSFALSVVPDRQATLRVLDIGCGAGDQIFDLASRLPNAHFVGVDFSAPNIAIAEQRRRGLPQASRISFAMADFLGFRSDAPFDLAVSFSALQWMAGGVEALASRVAEALAPRASFVNVMPYRCTFNHVLTAVRHVFVATRTDALDRLYLNIALKLHRGDLDPALLAERIPYLYALPRQFDDDVADALAQRGFRDVDWQRFPHASFAQLKHAGRIMRKPA